MPDTSDSHPQYHPGKRLARAYVPFQVFMTRLDPLEGLMKGTIFPELYDPYRPRKDRGGPDTWTERD